MALLQCGLSRAVPSPQLLSSALSDVEASERKKVTIASGTQVIYIKIFFTKIFLEPFYLNSRGRGTKNFNFAKWLPRGFEMCRAGFAERWGGFPIVRADGCNPLIGSPAAEGH
jgi:hypothetical protein